MFLGTFFNLTKFDKKKIKNSVIRSLFETSPRSVVTLIEIRLIYILIIPATILIKRHDTSSRYVARPIKRRVSFFRGAIVPASLARGRLVLFDDE